MRWTTWSPSSEQPETQSHPIDPGGHLDAPLVELMTRLGRAFDDQTLLVQAVSHRSWCAEAGGHPSNERLEFLGDAVLGFVVADHCYRTYSDSSEGDMAQVRSAVVNTNVLAEVAAELQLGDAVRLGRGEEASGGRSKASILADSFEAVIGAVYLDGGWEAARTFVLKFLGTRISAAAAGPGAGDHKTRLQEFVVHLHGQAPRYEVVGSGPDHDRRFKANVFVAGNMVGHGVGRSKKDAEQAAARVAWKTLEASREPGVVTDAVVTDPVVTDPVVTDPVVTDAVANESVVSDA
jgi:ribonuclease III